MSPRWRWITFAVLTAAFVGLAVVFVTRFGTDPSLSPSPLIGKPAPEVTVEVIEGGGPLTLGELRGKVAVVNFWAPWCVPCREEHGVLVEAAERYGPSGVEVLGIVYQSRLDDVIGFLDELGRGYPVAMDEGSRATILFGVRGVPETFFVDRDGTVVAKVTGPLDRALITSTLEAILRGDPVESRRTGEVQREP